jgi:hypothetical protein
MRKIGWGLITAGAAAVLSGAASVAVAQVGRLTVSLEGFVEHPVK